MKRDLYAKLLDWKGSHYRKPLILRGARQVGKTYLLKEFGRANYQNVVYVNFERDPGTADFFRGRLSLAGIIEKLSIYFETEILPQTTLLIFDEIQNAPEALGSLKYFAEEAGEYHVAAAGSLLGLKVNNPTAFPVGKTEFLELHPMSFGEFLEAAGKAGLRRLIAEKTSLEPLEAAFHEKLLHLLRLYYFVGGMPEAVALYIEDRSLSRVREIQRQILTGHVHDFGKHTTKTESIRLGRVRDSLPARLALENKKFRFADISPHARLRDYAEAFGWLSDAGLIRLCHALKAARLPLSGYRREGAFKAYILDVGLLGARLDLSERMILDGNRLFTEFHGVFVENYVAQELVAAGTEELYYWTSDSIAEVDFVVSSGDRIHALEAKAGSSTKTKSLRFFGEKYKIPDLSRTNLLNFKRDGGISNYPLYAVSRFPDLGGKL